MKWKFICVFPLFCFPHSLNVTYMLGAIQILDNAFFSSKRRPELFFRKKLYKFHHLMAPKFKNFASRIIWIASNIRTHILSADRKNITTIYFIKRIFFCSRKKLFVRKNSFRLWWHDKLMESNNREKNLLNLEIYGTFIVPIWKLFFSLNFVL